MFAGKFNFISTQPQPVKALLILSLPHNTLFHRELCLYVFINNFAGMFNDYTVFLFTKTFKELK